MYVDPKPPKGAEKRKTAVCRLTCISLEESLLQSFERLLTDDLFPGFSAYKVSSV